MHDLVEVDSPPPEVLVFVDSPPLFFRIFYFKVVGNGSCTTICVSKCLLRVLLCTIVVRAAYIYGL